MDNPQIKSHPALLQIFTQRLPDIEKRGDRFFSVCPFHDDHNPSLNFGRDDEGQWVYKCFSCGAAGDAIKFVQEFDKVTFSKALKAVEDVTQGDWGETQKTVDQVFKKIELGAVRPDKKFSLAEYAKLEVALYRSQEAQDWLFRERGISYDTAKKLHFGYRQEIDFVKLMKSDPELPPLWDQGWIALPALDNGEVVAIEYRSIKSKKFVRQPGMQKNVLWGLDRINANEAIYVVEGKFDMAVMEQAGFNAVSLASSSANLTPQMRDRIMQAGTIMLAGDHDGGSGDARMAKLHQEFQERTFRLLWPEGKKDANQVFIEEAQRDISVFRKQVDKLTLQAYANPMPGIQAIQDILLSEDTDSLLTREDRFHFPWKCVDDMAVILPGSVVYLSATQTSMGKSQFALGVTLNAARKQNHVVVNYQCEMSGSEIGTIVASHLLAKDRNLINREDRFEAARKLKDVQYYVGSDPDLNKMDDVLDLIEAAIRRLGATVVVLDHIHFICRTSGDEVKTQSQAMQRIKRMAQKYHLVFFVVGQPRKPSQGNGRERESDLSDAKGSEAITSDSDAVYFLHRDKLKNIDKDNPPMDLLSPEVQIRCMKGRSRGGGAAFAVLYFLGKIATFNEISRVEEPPIDNRFNF